MANSLKNMNISPYVGKAKMFLKGVRFLTNCKQIAVWRSKKSAISQTHFGLSIWGQILTVLEVQIVIAATINSEWC